jgi:competence protein ComEA
VDPSAAPWRVLESPAHDGRGAEPGSAGAGAQPGPAPGIHLTLPTLAAIAGAVVLAGIAFVLAFGSGSGELRIDGGTPFAGTEPSAPSDAANGTDLVVQISGAVIRPGVYRVAPGSRIGDLLAAAGGYGPRVDADRAGRDLNLAAPLKDGDSVRVPSRDDPPAIVSGTGGGGGQGGGGGGLIDINSATSAQLESLSGIGPVTAGKIIASREERSFGSVDELLGRKLVGPKTFEAIRELVTVR